MLHGRGHAFWRLLKAGVGTQGWPEGGGDGCGLCSTFSSRIVGLGHAWVQGKTLDVKTTGVYTGPEAGYAGGRQSV